MRFPTSLLPIKANRKVIDMDKYLLFNRSYLQPQGMNNLRLVLAQAKKDAENNPLFTEDFFSTPQRKWEVRYDNAYPNVIYDPKCKKYRCYYTLCSKDNDSASASKEERARRDYRPSPTRIASLGYAESDDGIHWSKPELGFVDFEGSKANNLLFRYAHGTGVFLDEEEIDPCKRYKMVTKVDFSGKRNFMAVNFSEDGVHWGDFIKWPRWNPPADSHNFPFRDKQDGLFKVITRIWKDGIRISAICSSPDFINWSAPHEIIRGSGFESQVYSMPVFWYEGMYLGLASMFHEGDRSADNFDTVDLELTFGSSSERFDRVLPGQYLIPRGEGKYPTGAYDCGCIFASPPIEEGDRLILYYMGGNGYHTNFRETSLCRAFLPKDRFAWYEQREEDKIAILPTQPFQAYGDALYLLADVAKGGKLKVSLHSNWRNEAYEGFSAEDCELSPAENGYMRVQWKRPLTSLENASFCFVFQFEKVKLYAIKGDIIPQNLRYYEGAAIL